MHNNKMSISIIYQIQIVKQFSEFPLSRSHKQKYKFSEVSEYLLSEKFQKNHSFEI